MNLSTRQDAILSVVVPVFAKRYRPCCHTPIQKLLMTCKQLPHFRRANSRDIPAMSKIRLAVSENVLSSPGRITEKMYEDYLELLGRGWVAEVDGIVAGFCYASNADASIWALFIEPSREGRGLGKQLLNMAVDWLFERGHDVVRLSTGSGTRAERFYASQGWTRERTEGNDVFYLRGKRR
ncbi:MULTISPECIES: GNAT family N-acetyltransferase [unclassified Janthinobacterium]|uniref:GNAT family N-acetyltransferase n=1 Tax=unclassified Janthinobacterium TaxID=2610881 RepID=UPI001E3683EF|nr:MULTISPECIES: GNAT family N-acetyltransferase [unclassified Janthinobacterium]MEC5160723.1 GNAT superfamily N-acetyltransferase [Janthinobacterium sp. CG_S6]